MPVQSNKRFSPVHQGVALDLYPHTTDSFTMTTQTTTPGATAGHINSNYYTGSQNMPSRNEMTALQNTLGPYLVESNDPHPDNKVNIHSSIAHDESTRTWTSKLVREGERRRRTRTVCM